MKAKIVASALGLGVVVGSLVGGTQVGAAPGGGAEPAVTRNYACDCETKVTTSALNLRSGPGTGYEVLLVMQAGVKLQAALDPDYHQNGFVKVAYGNNYGWAAEEYLADPGTGGDDIGGDASYEIVGPGVTTDRVNFRSGPGFDYAVQFVVEEGTQVGISDEVVDGFRYVWYDGTDGWISDDYLAADDGSGSVDGGEYTILATATTNDSVNFRAGPGTGYEILDVLAEGTEVEMTDRDENGFRFVFVNGTSGWVYDEYLTRPPASLPNEELTGTATTTDSVNFRVGPGFDYSVREVLEEGTEVETTDLVQNGFRYVAVDGTMGWIHDDYLA